LKSLNLENGGIKGFIITLTIVDHKKAVFYFLASLPPPSGF